MILRALAPLAFLTGLAAADGPDNERVNLDDLGQQATGGDSFRPVISSNGRHVAFMSAAEDLVPGDTNGVFDVFVRDREEGRTVRVSVSSLGEQANDTCFFPTDGTGRGLSISGTGRYVAFHSSAHNLVPVDVNYTWDCFVHDRDPDGNGVFDEGNGVTEMVSVDSSGDQWGTMGSEQPWISGGGRYVTFQSLGRLASNDLNSDYDVYVRDRKLGLTWLISMNSFGLAGNGPSNYPAISASGAYVAYESQATDLVAGDTNGFTDVFLTEVQSLFTRRVSVGPGNLQADGLSRAPHLSASGFQVVFSSRAENLYALDGNGFEDIFLHDITLDLTVPVSVDAGGQTGNDLSLHPWISTSGRYVAFESLASDLTGADSFHFRDVFLLDRKLGRMDWVSQAYTGAYVWPDTDGRNRWPSVSANGKWIAFESESTNLVPGDTNDTWDAFVRTRHLFGRDPSQ